MPNMGRGTDSGDTDMKEMIYIFSRNYKKEMNNIHCFYIYVTDSLTLYNESSSSDLCSNLLGKQNYFLYCHNLPSKQLWHKCVYVIVR